MAGSKKKAKRKATLKTKAKRVGRKAKKVAKTDIGRAGIGAGVGALALGPVGAVAGTYVGLKTKPKKKRKANPKKRKSKLKTKAKRAGKKVGKAAKATVGAVTGAASGAAEGARAGWKAGKGRKRNPEEMVKFSTVMGTMLLDYQKASPNIEHVAASALRGEKVEVKIAKRARADLAKLRRIQPTASEKAQIGELVEAFDKVLKPKRAGPKRMMNPPEVDATFDRLAKQYTRAESRHRELIASPSSTAAQQERSQRRLDDAENKLLIYADIQGMSAAQFKRRLKGRVPNPLRRVPKGASKEKVREVVGRNIAAEMKAGRPQKQAVAIALSQARRDAPGPTMAAYGPAPNPRAFELETEIGRGRQRKAKKAIGARAGTRAVAGEVKAKATRAKLARLNPDRFTEGDFVAVKTARQVYKGRITDLVGDRIGIREEAPPRRALTIVPKKTPHLLVWHRGEEADVGAVVSIEKARAPKRNPKRKTSPEWQRLIKRCQKLWEEYCKYPSKARLEKIFDHLDKMKVSTSKKVKEERSRCLRSANAEAKRLRIKR